MSSMLRLTRIALLAALCLIGGLAQAQVDPDVPVEEPSWTQVRESVDGLPLSIGDTIEVQWSPETGNLFSQAMLDMMALRKDRAYIEELSAMDVRLTLHVLARKHEDYADWSPSEQYDSLMVVILEMGQRNGVDSIPGLDTTLDEKTDAEVLTTGVHYLRAIVEKIEVNSGSGYEEVDDLPKGVELEMQVEWRRLEGLNVEDTPDWNSPVEFGCTGTQGTETSESTILNLSWGSLPGAVEYHLEWAYVDDYKAGDTDTEMLPIQLHYNFKEDATRIVTDKTFYRLPLLFDRGWLVYRVRAVGRDPGAIELPIYGAWTNIPEAGTVGALSFCKWQITTAKRHNRNKNWQVTSTYAEQGKSKEVMVYADGTSRQRQTVTRNSSLNVPVIAQTFYDAVGRAAVEVLPVPVLKDHECQSLGDEGGWAPIDYYNKFNQAGGDEESDAGNPFDYTDLQQTGNSCGPLATRLDENDGAELYYNSKSLVEPNALFEQSSFIPKADGYPYVQTEYMPDNTGRVKRKGGVGEAHQLASGHATRYMYGTPEQIKLDRLFGSEAPYASQCQKNITIDANGQGTATYLDGSGHTIATALIGSAPEGMVSLPSAATQTLVNDLFGGQPSTACDLNHYEPSTGTYTYMNVLNVPQDNMILSIDHTVDIPTFNDDCLEGVCYHCVYDLSIRLQDAECGDVIYERLGIVGHFNQGENSVYFDCDTPYTVDPWSFGPNTSNPFTQPLTAGNYILTKVLSVHSEARDQYAADYASGVHLDPGCFASVQELTDSIMFLVDTDDCSITCAECAEDLGTVQHFILTTGGTAAQWQELYDECTEPCREESWCTVAYETMLSDVRPGGQYATYSYVADDVVVNELTSIFRGGGNGRLYHRFTPIYAPTTDPIKLRFDRELWQQPRLYNAAANVIDEVGYFGVDGLRSTIPLVTFETNPTYTDFNFLLEADADFWLDTDGLYHTYPEHLANLEDFLPYYLTNPTWAKSLVYLHPEYGYYVNCSTFAVIQSGQTKSSDEWDQMLRGTLQTEDYDDLQNDVGKAWITDASVSTVEQRTSLYYDQTANGNPASSGTYPWQMADPYVSAETDGGLELAEKYKNYVSAGGTMYSMPEFASIVTRCGGIFNTPDPVCLNFADASGGTSEQILLDEWRTLVRIYLAEKYRIQKRYADLAVTTGPVTGPTVGANHCIGEGSAQGWKLFLKHEEVYSASGPGPVTGTSAFYDPPQPCSSSQYHYYADKVRRVAEPESGEELMDQDLANWQNYQATGQCPMATAWMGVFAQLSSIGALQDNGTADLHQLANYQAVLLAESNYQPNPPSGAADWEAQVDGDGTLTAIINYVVANETCTLSLDPPDDFVWENVIQPLQLIALNNAGDFNLIFAYLDDNEMTTVQVAGHMCDDLFELAPCSFNEVCDRNAVGDAFLEFLNLHGTGVNDLSGSNNTLNPGTGPIKNLFSCTSSTGNMKFDVLTNYDPGSGTVPFAFAYHDPTTVTFPCFLQGPTARLFITLEEFYNAAGTGTNLAYLDGVASFDQLRSEGDNKYVVDLYDVNDLFVGTMHGHAYWRSGSVNATDLPYALGTCTLPPPAACSSDAHLLPIHMANVVRERLLQLADEDDWDTFNTSIDLFASPNMTPLLANALEQFVTCAGCTSGAYYTTSSVTHPTSTHLITFTTNATPEPQCALSVEVDFTNDNVTYFDEVSDFQFNGSLDADGYYHELWCDLKDGGTTIGHLIINASCLDFKACEMCTQQDILMPGGSTPLNVPQECYERWVHWHTWAMAFNASEYAACEGFYLDGTDLTYEQFRALNLCQCLNILIPVGGDLYFFDAQHPTDLGCGENGFYTTEPDIFNLGSTPCILNVEPENPCVQAYGEYLNAIDLFMSASNYGSVTPIVPLTPLEAYGQGYCPCLQSYTSALLGTLSLDPGIGVPVWTISGYTEDLVSVPDFCTPPPCTPPFVLPPPPQPPQEDPCVTEMLEQAELDIQWAIAQQEATYTTYFQNAYNERCSQVMETLSETYQDPEHHYTLYYYDQAGNLVRTVPPEGVEPLRIGEPGYSLGLGADTIALLAGDRLSGNRSLYTRHRLSSEYTFNSLNNPTRQLMPDQDAMNVWETRLPSGLPSDLRITNVQFIGGGQGFLSGWRSHGSFNRGYVFHTGDAGNTWERRFGLLAADLKNLYFLDASNGMAVGAYGTVLYTSDGGASWDQQAASNITHNNPLADVQIQSSSSAWVVGAGSLTSGLLRNTANYGSTFPSTTNPTNVGNLFGPFSAITGWGSSNLVVVGKTPDGNNGLWTHYTNGPNWSTAPILTAGSTMADIRTMSPATSSELYAAGTYGVLLNHPTTTTYTTTSWNTVKTGTTDDFISICFFNHNDGVAIMDSSGFTVLRYTGSGGESWLPLYTGAHLNALVRYQTSPGGAFAIGNDGELVQIVMPLDGAAGVIPFGAVGTENLISGALEFVDGKLCALFGGEGGTLFRCPDLLIAGTPAWTATASALGSQPIKAIVAYHIGTTQLNVAMIGGQDASGQQNFVPRAWVLATNTLNAAPAGASTNVTTAGTQRNYQSVAIVDVWAMLYNQRTGKLDRYNLSTMPASAPAVLTTNTTPPAALTNLRAAVAMNNDHRQLVLLGPPVGADPTALIYGSAINTGYTGTTFTNTSNAIRPLPLNDLVDGLSNGSSIACADQGTFFTRNSTSGAWRAVPTRFLGDLRGITNSSGIVAVGDDGTILHGTSLVSTAFSALACPTMMDLHDIAFVGNACTISGENGTVLHTTDFTNLGTHPFVPLLHNSGDIHGLATRTGSDQVTAVGVNGLVHKLTGPSRMVVNEVFTDQINDVHFLNENEGYAAGDTRTLRHTNDGGYTWEVVSTVGPTTGNYRAVFTYGDNAAYAVGSQGLSRTITDNTTADLLGLGTTFTLNDVEVAPSGAALVVGQNSSGAIGRYWTKKPTTSTWTAGTLTRALNTICRLKRYITADDFLVGALTTSPADNDLFCFRYQSTGNSFTVNGGYNALSAANSIKRIWLHDRTGGLVVTADRIYRLTLTDPYSGSGTMVQLPTSQYPDMLNSGLQNNMAQIQLSTIAFSDRNNGFFGGLTTGTIPGYARVINDDNGLQSQRMWYDRLGRLVFSQNSKQFDPDGDANTADPKNYSYTRYDELGRPFEAGQVTAEQVPFANVIGDEVNGVFNPAIVDDGNVPVFLEGNLRTELTTTYYDEEVAAIPVPMVQDIDLLRLRVATTTYQDAMDNNAGTTTIDNDPLTYEHATHYAYDIHGNVKDLVQDIPQMNRDAQNSSSPPTDGQRFKTLHYTYDLISGNVKQVSYQDGMVDQYYHQYEYDADNRLITAQAGSSGVTWREDARYFYYPHGPLKRMELGNYPVQGVDYAYTLHGWLKGVNSDLLRTSNDMGQDGEGIYDTGDPNPHAWLGKDAFGFSLHYFPPKYDGGNLVHLGDYTPIDNALNADDDRRPWADADASTPLAQATHPLYNGNISRWSNTLRPVANTAGVTGWNPDSVGTEIGQVLASVYQYDQLNRLLSAHSNFGLTSSNDWTGAAMPTNLYRSEYVYDANGNIKKAQRWNRTEQRYDSLSYFYHREAVSPTSKLVRNRLYHLRDDDPNAVVTDVADLDEAQLFYTHNGGSPQTSTANNYGYDAIGNLTRDTREQIESIGWTVAGKVASVTRTAGSTREPLKFGYGAQGHRIRKDVFAVGTTDLELRWYYIHDAQGNIMAVYRYNVASPLTSSRFFLQERPLYGSDRLGMDRKSIETTGLTSLDHNGVKPTPTADSQLNYELKDHLGNVATVVTGELIGLDGADVGSDLDFKVPNVSTYVGYEAFGSELPGRHYNGGNYRFGFNGKENDNEVHNATGTFQDYGMRGYDPRIARFISVDPIAKQFPMLTPYQFASNSPIQNIDLDGEEGYQYCEAMTDNEGETCIKRVVEFDVHLGISEDGAGHSGYTQGDIPAVRDQLHTEYNREPFKDSDGNVVEFRFNIIPFDETMCSPDDRAAELRKDPSNLLPTIGDSPHTQALKGGVMARTMDLPALMQGKTSSLGRTLINATALDQSHTQGHEIVHQFLNYNPALQVRGEAGHKDAGGIMNYRTTHEDGTTDPTIPLNQDNVDRIIQSVPEVSPPH